MKYLNRVSPIIICALVLTACQNDSPQRDPIPKLAPKDESAALAILQQRAAAIHSVNAKCKIELTGTNGKTIQFDGSIALAPPNRLQLVGTKNGQVVLSTTFRPDGLWIQPDNSSSNSPVSPAALSEIIDIMKLLVWSSGNYFNEQSLAGATVPIPGKQPEFEYDVPMHNSTAVVCEVDIETVTPRKFSLVDETATVRLAVELSEYRPFGEIVWPTRIVGSGKEIGTISLSLSDVQINGQLDPHAFDPPAGAVKQ